MIDDWNFTPVHLDGNGAHSSGTDINRGTGGSYKEIIQSIIMGMMQTSSQIVCTLIN